MQEEMIQLSLGIFWQNGIKVIWGLYVFDDIEMDFDSQWILKAYWTQIGNIIGEIGCE